jgi:hypothetical protein
MFLCQRLIAAEEEQWNMWLLKQDQFLNEIYPLTWIYVLPCPESKDTSRVGR